MCSTVHGNTNLIVQAARNQKAFTLWQGNETEETKFDWLKLIVTCFCWDALIERSRGVRLRCVIVCDCDAHSISARAPSYPHTTTFESCIPCHNGTVSASCRWHSYCNYTVALVTTLGDNDSGVHDTVHKIVESAKRRGRSSFGDMVWICERTATLVNWRSRVHQCTALTEKKTHGSVLDRRRNGTVVLWDTVLYCRRCGAVGKDWGRWEWIRSKLKKN